MRFLEVSHKIEAGMQTYPGLPEPRQEVLLDYDTSHARYNGLSEFYIASLHLCGNTGTYVDSPMHRHRGAADLSQLPLERLAHIPAVLVDATSWTEEDRGIGPGTFRSLGQNLAGKAVLVHTGFSRHWRTDRYLDRNPFLTADACDFLLNAGIAFAGIDSMNIDDFGDLARPAHTLLLSAGVPICEHMTNLSGLAADPDGWRIHAVPIAWVGGATFPVRAYLIRE
jgi:arylformamidase